MDGVVYYFDLLAGFYPMILDGFYIADYTFNNLFER